MENNFRENKEDILKEWLDFREDTELAYWIMFVIIMRSIIGMGLWMVCS